MSQYWDILVAVKSALDALPAFGGVPIEIRERPWHSTEHGDPLPMAVISPMTESVGEKNFKGVWMDYPVVVTFYQAKGGPISSVEAIQKRLDVREAVRTSLFVGKPFTSLPSVLAGISYDPSPSIDLAGLDQQVKASTQQVVFRNSEPTS